MTRRPMSATAVIVFVALVTAAGCTSSRQLSEHEPPGVHSDGVDGTALEITGEPDVPDRDLDAAIDWHEEAEDGVLEKDTAEELRRMTQDPVAYLVSVPFQNDFGFNTGHRRRTGYVLNIQPVIPFRLTMQFNVITRTILPVIDAPEITPGFGDETGLGDVDFTAFLVPSEAGRSGWRGGIGPTVSFPSATEDDLGSERWGLGPSAVIVNSDETWTYGALLKNQWDVGGDSDRRHINRGVFQPFVNYNLDGGWYLASGPLLTVD